MYSRELRSSSLGGDKITRARLSKRKRESQRESSYDLEYSKGNLSDERGKLKLTAKELDQRENQILNHLEQWTQLKKQAKIELNQVIMRSAFTISWWRHYQQLSSSKQ